MEYRRKTYINKDVKMIVKGMEKEKNIKLLKQLAKDIAQSKYKWLIMKEINDMIDYGYDKYHFDGILAKYGISKSEYFKILEELENRELLITLKNTFVKLYLVKVSLFFIQLIFLNEEN